MNHQDLTLEELERSGWTVKWEPTVAGDETHQLVFALDLHGQAVSTIETAGATQDEALTAAVKRANAWLDHERRLEEERAGLDL